MARKLPKIESIVITGFLLCVALWAVSKCSDKRHEMARKIKDLAEDEDRPVRHDTVVVKQQPAATATPQPAASAPVVTQQTPAQPSGIQQEPGKLPKMLPQGSGGATGTTTTTATTVAPKPSTSSSASAAAGSILYVTIDGLKMRKEPGLKGDLVAKLELYEPVTFLNKKTEWTQEISLGKETVTDHWVKVRTKSGKEGWVFGAGVHYYKMKRKGVLE